VDGIQNFDLTVFEFGSGFDVFKQLHQGNQGVVRVLLWRFHGSVQRGIGVF
jgi:hypothetical protein